MRMLRKSIVLCILCTFAAMLMTSCGQNDADKLVELNYCISAAPSTIDPQLVSDTGSAGVVVFFVSTLYEYNSERELVPGLAESCEVSEDGLTVTYHLREGLKWSNGQPLTADDFVFGFQRLADPQTKSNSVYLMTDCCYIRNSMKISTGDLPVSELGVSAPDSLTFIVELEQPCPYINSILSLAAFAPCSRDFFNSCGSSYGDSFETMLSCGPYILDRYDPLPTQIHLKRNPYYYRDHSHAPDGINLQVVGDMQQAIMCYESGMLDILQIGGEIADLASGDPHLQRYSTAQVYKIEIDHRNKYLSNKNIRIAISKSIDRASIAKNVIRNGYVAMTRVIPQDFYTETDGKDFAEDVSLYDDTVGYDKAKASEYWAHGLRELGVSSVDLEFYCSSSQTKIAEAITQQLEDNLSGLSITLYPLPDKEWLRRMTVGDDYDLILSSWVADYTDPTALFYSCYGTGSNAQYCGSEFAELVNKCLNAKGAERDEMLHKAEEILMDDIALIPLFGGQATYIFADGVSGFQVSPTGAQTVITGIRKELK